MSDDYAGPGVPTFGPPICPRCKGKGWFGQWKNMIYGYPLKRCSDCNGTGVVVENRRWRSAS